MSVNAGAVRVGRRINFNHWAEADTAVIASSAARGRKLRTIIDCVRVRRRRRINEWRMIISTAQRLVIDPGSDSKTSRWCPRQTIVVAVGGFARR